MSIVGGFFGKLSEDITDKKQYIRARVEEDRTYLRQQGLKRQSGIQQQRSNYEDAANMLVRRGADRSQVLGLLSSDPKGLMEVYKTNFTGEQLKTSFTLAEDYKNESTMSEILGKIVPTIQAMPKDSSPDKIKRKSLGAYLGLDLDTELNDQVYSQDIVGGMTGDDILGSIGSPIESKGSNPDGVTYNFDRKQNTALTGSQVNGLFDTANSDYSESDIADYIKNIDTIVKIEPGETPEAFKDRKARLSDTAMDFGKATGLDRLAIGIELFGVRENTQSVYNEYGARLFSATNGVNKNLLSMLGASGKDNQTIIDEVSSAFGSDPDLLEHTIEIEGKPVIFTREEYEAEKAGSSKPIPESLDPETPGVSSSPRPKSRPDVNAMPGLGDRRAARNEGMEGSTEGDQAEEPEVKTDIEELQSVTDTRNKVLKTVGDSLTTGMDLAATEASWLGAAVFSKLNQQLAQLSAIFYKPTETGAALLSISKEADNQAEEILEKGLREVMKEYKEKYPGAKQPSKKSRVAAIKTAKKSLGDSYRETVRRQINDPDGLTKAIEAYNKKYNIDQEPKRGN